MAQAATDIAQAAADLTQAFNDSDWERGRSLCAPGVVYNETGTGRRIEGVDAYVELLQGWKEAFPDVRGTIRRSLADNDTVAQDILWEGTHTGPMQTPAGALTPTGNRISVQGTVWVSFEGAKVREVHNHLDVLALLQQTGALPAA
jgi:predicted ester cyclase